MSGKIVSFTGADDSNVYVRRDAENNVEIAGDLTIGGQVRLENADISNTTGLITYEVGPVDYPLYPSFVKIISPVPTITKQTSPTKVSGGSYTIPQDGYYTLTAQVSLATIGSSTPASDTITIYADLSGGSITPINGAINTFNVVPNASNAFYATSSGLIQQKLTAGDVIEMYHLESGGFTIGGASAIGISYKYEGNKAV